MNISYKGKIVYRNKEVVQQYDKLRFSTLLGRLVDKLEKTVVLELLQIKVRTKVVIDVPCGTGRITEALTNDNRYIVGADISKNMVLFAHGRLRRYKNVDFVLCDAERMPFKSDVSDSTVSVRLMGHVPSNTRIRILSELKRVTKRHVIISYYHPLSILGIVRRIKTGIKRTRESWFPITPRKLKTEMKKSGLNIRKTKSILALVAETYFVLAE